MGVPNLCQEVLERIDTNKGYVCMWVLSNDIFGLYLGLIDMTQPCGPSGISPKIKDILGGRENEMIWVALDQHVKETMMSQ